MLRVKDEKGNFTTAVYTSWVGSWWAVFSVVFEGAISTSRRFFAVPCKVHMSLALEASFPLGFVRFDATNMFVAE
jgi:hypothetical protein